MNYILLDAGNPGGNLIMQLLMWGGIIVVFYFLLLRPQKKKQKQEEDLRNTVAVGDIVAMTSGITGKVICIKDDEVTIENGLSRTQLTFMRGAITSIKEKGDGIPPVPSVDDKKAELQKKLDEKNAAKKAEKEAAKEASKNPIDDKIDLK